jgi:ribosome-associated translation inhibitor RaiA
VAHDGADKAITIQSSNIHLGDGLPDYARENILRVASKYFGRLNTASAHFTKEGITYRCSVNMQMGGLPMRSAEGKNKDIYVACRPHEGGQAASADQARASRGQWRARR